MVEIAIGAKVVVTQNINTDLDITNGAQRWNCWHDTSSRQTSSLHWTHHQTKIFTGYILVKVERTRATKLEGLNKGIIPIKPASYNIHISIQTKGHKYITCSVTQWQFSMTAAYAFTDYWSQGQIIPVVMIDVAKPPTGKLNLFNLYVAPSRSSGRSTIQLLQDFENKISRHHTVQSWWQKTTDWKCWIETQRSGRRRWVLDERADQVKINSISWHMEYIRHKQGHL